MTWYRMRDDLRTPSGIGGADMFHINFGGRRAREGVPRPCSVCGYISEVLCDWKLRDILHSSKRAPATCDRPLCSYCRTTVGEDRDLCPRHVLRYRAWLAGRTNSTEGAGP